MYNKIVKTRKRLGDAASKEALGSAKRLTYFEPSSTTPGPGEYVSPSAFGHYVARTALESSKESERSLSNRHCAGRNLSLHTVGGSIVRKSQGQMPSPSLMARTRNQTKFATNKTNSASGKW